MPQVMVRHLAGVFTRQQQVQLMDDILEAFVRIGGEGIRPTVNVTVEEVADGLWSVGGTKLTIEEIEARRKARREAGGT
jgi:phenylpyruvate tautomerase PptA (4-oxalocrotonate tautomerase family)